MEKGKKIRTLSKLDDEKNQVWHESHVIFIYSLR